MSPDAIGAALWVLAVVLVCLAFRGAGKGRRAGTLTGVVAGTLYEWQNQDKPHAIEIIVEGQAGARDPEDRDGHLPDLETPRKA